MDAGVPKYDFDLNIPYKEDMDSNDETKKDDEKENSPLVQNTTQGIQDVTKTSEDNGNNQLVPVAEGSTSLANYVSEVSDEEEEEEDVEQPLPFIDFLHVDGYQGVTMTGRRRYHRRGRARPIDNTKICSNIRCKSRNTPMWRTGPLGSQTLCNACGIYYRRQMRSAESRPGTRRVSFTLIWEDDSDSSSGSVE